MSGNSAPQYGTPEFEDITLEDVGSVKAALEAAATLTPEQLEAVWAQETISGGNW